MIIIAWILFVIGLIGFVICFFCLLFGIGLNKDFFKEDNK